MMNEMMYLGLTAAALVGGFWYWNTRVRRIPLAEFGIENVQRVLRWETDARREAIWRRGWMTSHEWDSINARQLATIDAELNRRGINPEAKQHQR